MLVTESRIPILGTCIQGIFFCRARKMTKFGIFMFRDSLLSIRFALSHSLTLPRLRLTRDSSSFKMLFDAGIVNK